jgi:hypothetical protein
MKKKWIFLNSVSFLSFRFGVKIDRSDREREKLAQTPGGKTPKIHTVSSVYTPENARPTT